jgi:malonate transporter
MVLIATLPPVFAGMILAIRYHSYVEIASSTLIVSALLFAGAAPIWIAIARSLAT